MRHIAIFVRISSEYKEVKIIIFVSNQTGTKKIKFRNFVLNYINFYKFGSNCKITDNFEFFILVASAYITY